MKVYLIISDNLNFGLYPVKGNWYYDDIKTEYDEESKRYLRYITGEKAKRFYDIASYLKKFNKCYDYLDNLWEKVEDIIAKISDADERNRDK